MHILVNDFIGGALDRGIPLYVRNIVYGLKENDIRVSVIRAPAFIGRLPRICIYIMAVLIEQLLLPLIGLITRADITLYPYNSIAILDVLSGRGRIVVHDLEVLSRPGFSATKFYYRICYRALRWFNAPIFTISDLTRTRILQHGVFGACPIKVLPNTFYIFEDLIRAESATKLKNNSLLLCTGSTPNKDLDSIVSNFLPGVLQRGLRVSILGLHKKSDFTKFNSLSDFLRSGQIRICGQLSDQEVAREYRSHALVWVHSLREGFGRCVVEGRLAGRRVICSAIPEFITLKDEGVTLYSNAAEFAQELTALVQNEGEPCSYAGYPYRQFLRDAVRAGL